MVLFVNHGTGNDAVGGAAQRRRRARIGGCTRDDVDGRIICCDCCEEKCTKNERGCRCPHDAVGQYTDLAESDCFSHGARGPSRAANGCDVRQWEPSTRVKGT